MMQLLQKIHFQIKQHLLLHSSRTSAHTPVFHLPQPPLPTALRRHPLPYPHTGGCIRHRTTWTTTLHLHHQTQFYLIFPSTIRTLLHRLVSRRQAARVHSERVALLPSCFKCEQNSYSITTLLLNKNTSLRLSHFNFIWYFYFLLWATLFSSANSCWS